MVKEESGAEARVAGVRKRKPYRIFLSTYQIRCALRALNEAALLVGTLFTDRVSKK